MIAVKGNKSYMVDDVNKGQYLKAGFDILDSEGNIIEHGLGNTVSYEQYKALKNELQEAQKSTEIDFAVAEILTAYAAEHGINIGKTSTVAGLVKKIKSEG